MSKQKTMSSDLIAHILGELRRDIIANHKEFKTDLDEIKTQTQKTNGRVSSLEKWRAYLAGAMAILSLLVLPIILSLIYKYI